MEIHILHQGQHRIYGFKIDLIVWKSILDPTIELSLTSLK